MGLREVLASHQLVVSAPLFTELKQVLHQKIQIPAELMDDTVAMLQQAAHAAPGPMGKVIYAVSQKGV
ncbi:MAG: hypothetical protein HXY46_11620 [Syntrophaceae bacterium]|nr:hypothetical protein [Syntrophaceae bacterium]